MVQKKVRRMPEKEVNSGTKSKFEIGIQKACHLRQNRIWRDESLTSEPLSSSGPGYALNFEICRDGNLNALANIV
jgi:hypothetical protein